MLFGFAGQSFKKKKRVDILYYRRGAGGARRGGRVQSKQTQPKPPLSTPRPTPSLHRVAQGGLKTTRLVNCESFWDFCATNSRLFWTLSSFHPSCVVCATLCFISFVGFMSGRCSIRATGKVPLFYCMPLNTVTIKWPQIG